MISISSLQESDKGREVRYSPRRNWIEYGRITSWNPVFIFVRYHTVIDDGLRHTQTGETSAATRPEDLEWVWPAPVATPWPSMTPMNE